MIDWAAVSAAKRAYEAKVNGRPVSNKNDDAREAGIPKMFRQYAARYGVGVDEIVRKHKQFPTPELDHWRDKGNAVRKALGYPVGERSEWA